MTVGTWTLYDQVPELLGKGLLDWDSDTLKAALVGSGYTPSAAHTQWSDVSANEIANGDGYTTGGAGITGTVTRSGGTTKFGAAADPTWTASGGSITARYAVIRKVGTVGGLVDPVVAYCLLDTTPADVTATAGQNLILTTPANGFFSGVHSP